VTQVDQKDMFNSLVENALDFLTKARAELSDNPKYSLIHFHAAVELFLKARLMHEHWTLVIARNQEPDWDKFVAGDFQSITMDDAANKLDKIVRSGLSQDELKTFKSVAKHRNKLVHFFHQDKVNGVEFRNQIVRVELKAWYSLHDLLKERWKDVFIGWSKQIIQMDKNLRQLHEYLTEVFDNLQATITAETKAGSIFVNCPSCGFVAQKHDTNMGSVYLAQCLVCELIEQYLKFECTECDHGVVTFANERGICPNCQAIYVRADLADVLSEETSAYDVMNGGGDINIGNCAFCDGYQTVFKMKNSDKWLCSECLSQFETMEACQWCNELNSGNMEYSYAKGCNFCEGMIGWRGDD
jgi:hypothetical protein